MPRSVKQNEAMRAATKTAVLNSAITLFGQNGYAHTSTRAIAKEAGISVGLMYHYFAGKEELLKAVVEDSLRRIAVACEAPYMGEFTPSQRLTSLLRNLTTILEDDPNFWSLFQMLRSQPAILRLMGDAFLQATHSLRALFETELTLMGRQNPRLDAYMLYCVLEGLIQQYLLEPDSYPLSEMMAEIVKTYGDSS